MLGTRFHFDMDELNVMFNMKFPIPGDHVHTGKQVTGHLLTNSKLPCPRLDLGQLAVRAQAISSLLIYNGASAPLDSGFVI